MSIENEIYCKKSVKNNYVNYSDILGRTDMRNEIISILHSFDERRSDVHYKNYSYSSPTKSTKWYLLLYPHNRIYNIL